MTSLGTVLITGCSGLVGARLVNLLGSTDLRIFAGSTSNKTYDSDKVSHFPFPDLASDFLLINELKKCDVIVHCAGITSDANDQGECESVNHFGTARLAEQAALAGVKRFIFISSIKVNGEATSINRGFLESDMPNPSGNYASSKLEAEKALLKISESSSMDVVIIRPPLVYGPGVQGNFKVMMSLVKSCMPLPLGAVQNLRSMVFVDNLCDFVIHSLDHADAKNQIFNVSDINDLSTKELLKTIAALYGKKLFLIPVPQVLLELAARMLNKQSQLEKVVGSLIVDTNKAQKVLGWKPAVSVHEGLKQTVLASGQVDV